MKSHKIALIQLGYMEAGEGPKAILLRVHGKTKLPNALISLFHDATITFIGRAVGGDLSRIGRDFKVEKLMGKVVEPSNSLIHAFIWSFRFS